VLGFEAVASELGMSKTPVRLALHELAGEGFLEWRRQRRLHVIEPTPDLRRKALELRIRLEEIAVARACALPGDSHVEQLRRELGRQRSADGRTRVELEEDFHLEIARAAGLPLLADVLRTAVGLTLLAGWNDGDASSSFSEHEALVDAIARRDAPGARAVLAKHLCIAHDGARQPATACG
jgi:DNA-binding GntR family transcriptional regulator